MDKKYIPLFQIMKTLLPSCIVDFILGVIFLMMADNLKGRVQYYWSSEVRSAVGWLTGIAMVLFLLAGIQLGLGIVARIIIKKGRVCSHCGKITTSPVAACPFCQSDLSDAISIQKMVSAPPKVSVRPAAPVERTAPPAQRAGELVCPQCHQPISQGDTFCAVCGCKVTPPAQPVVCPVCQTEAKPGDKFCKKCGGALPGGQHTDT